MRVRLGEAQFDLGKLVADVESRPASIPAFEQALAVQEALARDRRARPTTCSAWPGPGSNWPTSTSWP